MLALRAFLSKTYMGRAITAASQDKKAAQLMGINTNRVYRYAFAIAMGSAGSGRCFSRHDFSFTPNIGIFFSHHCLWNGVIGGLGSMAGLFRRHILGVFRTLGGYFLGPASQMLIVYVLVLVILADTAKGAFRTVRKDGTEKNERSG